MPWLEVTEGTLIRLRHGLPHELLQVRTITFDPDLGLVNVTIVGRPAHYAYWCMALVEVLVRER